ncbi:MAG: hypothetical protein IJ055_04715 [Oscillospiraceae bacterium]|nr:hypothetical protein [Oscillospiraceae bacterium]
MRYRSAFPIGYVNSIGCVGDSVWGCTDSGIGFIHEGTFKTVTNIPMNPSVEEMTIDYQHVSGPPPPSRAS